MHDIHKTNYIKSPFKISKQNDGRIHTVTTETAYIYSNAKMSSFCQYMYVYIFLLKIISLSIFDTQWNKRAFIDF